MDHLGFPKGDNISEGGAVQGRPAVLRYSHNPPKFSWKIDGEPYVEYEIDAYNIIGILPISQQLSHDYTFLYVESEPRECTTVEKKVFKALMVTRPPEDLIKAYMPSGRSCWATRHHKVFDAKVREQQDLTKAPLNVILSTKSGHGKAEAAFENVLKPFLHHVGCMDYALFRTESTESIHNLCRDVFLPAASRGSLKMIILLSGDGGIVDLVNGLIPPSLSQEGDGAQRKLPPDYIKHNLCILPLGTGNALAHSSGVTDDGTLGMRTLMCGQPAPLPMFSVRFSPPARAIIPPSDEATTVNVSEEPTTEAFGAVVFSWALHAALVADSDTPSYRAHGSERFSMAAKENLFQPGGPHPYKGKLWFQRSGSDIWEEVFREAHNYLLATLCSNLEESFSVSPASKPLDGKLRLVHFGPDATTSQSLSSETIVDLMKRAYEGGKHVQDPIVGYEEIERLKLEINEPDDAHFDEAKGGHGRFRRVCVDGKIYLCEVGTVIEVRGPKYTPSVVEMVRSSC